MAEGRRRILSWKLFRYSIYFGTALAMVGALFVTAYVYNVMKNAPNAEELADHTPKITSRVMSGEGRVIAEFANENRLFVPYQSIPAHVVHAFMSAEDKKFFDHDGIDYLGMARGISRTALNKVRGRSGMQGGSTITQQVAKTYLLSSDRTVDRKIKEFFIARRMEKIFSKEKIMEFYLNEIYLGGNGRGENYYGVGSAALNYFDKSLTELDLAEAATLAALAQRPGAVNPYSNAERLVVRRNWVLGRMVVNGYISEAEAEAEKAKPLRVVRRLRGEQYDAAMYFVQELRKQLVEQYSEATLQEEGLSIRSTIDIRLQIAAQNALRDGLVTYDRRHDYRGPFFRIEPGPDAVAKLTAITRHDPFDWNTDGTETVITRPAGYGVWEAAMIQSMTDARTTLLLHDGYEVDLTPEDVDWARSTFEREDGSFGLRVGDVILVDVTRKPESEVPDAARATAAAVEPVLEAGLGEVIGEGAILEDRNAPEIGQRLVPVGPAELRQIPEADGALVAMDPHTGRVLAMAGGFSYYHSAFNRVTQANRQPGSAFKPFVYTAALELGYTPASTIMDAPISIWDTQEQDWWTPKNYVAGEFNGLSTIRLGLEKSRNLMTVRLAQNIGLEPIAELAEDLEIYDEMDLLLPGSLGSQETTPLRLARAYAALVNGGKLVEPTLVDRVQDRNGLTLFRYDERACEGCNAEEWDGGPPPTLFDPREQVVDPVTAYQTVHMLEGVVQRGTGRSVLKVGKPLAGKTGTTNEGKDAWFIGFSPDLVVAVWVGNDDPTSLGPRETGGSVAAPIFTDFMEVALADEPAIPFRIPPGVRLVEIDARSGKLPGPTTAVRIVEAFRPGTEPGLAFDEDRGLGVFGTDNTTTGIVSPDGGAGEDGDGDAPLPEEDVIEGDLDGTF